MTDHEPDLVGTSLQDVASGLPVEGSLLDALTQAWRETAEITEVDISLPGWRNGDLMLYAKYQLLEGKQLQKITKRTMKEFKKEYERNYYGGIDIMIAACCGFTVSVDGEKQPLTIGGEPITGYNQQLAEALKLTVDPSHPARSIVMAMFRGNDVALGAHTIKLSRWMADTSIDVDEELLGNP